MDMCIDMCMIHLLHFELWPCLALSCDRSVFDFYFRLRSHRSHCCATSTQPVQHTCNIRCNMPTGYSTGKVRATHMHHKCNLRTTCMQHVCNMYTTYMQHVCNMYTTYMQHARNMHATCMQHVCNMYAYNVYGQRTCNMRLQHTDKTGSVMRFNLDRCRLLRSHSIEFVNDMSGHIEFAV